MQDDPTLPWAEYLRAWLQALCYHPDQHHARGMQHAGTARQDDVPPARQDRAA